jgi:hypothetical protein
MARKLRYLPRLILCAVGDDTFPAGAEQIAAAAGLEHEVQGPDERMQDAFESAQDRVHPSLDKAEFRRIAEHQSVVYVLSENYPSDQAAQNSHRLLRAGRDLLAAGGIGLKCESSGIAHSRQRWLDLAQQADEGFQGATDEQLPDEQRESACFDFWQALLHAYVQLLIVAENGDIHTCGMHLLGQPDLIIGSELAIDAFGDTAERCYSEIARLFEVFGLYLLTEGGGMETGHTFRCSDDDPRFSLVLEDCTGYDEDEFFFNPYGRWRFAERVG